ncbi:uncharacterized protein [Miscanthus floridulus]|uniref:uncharacterized protein n=1 Tax=Miscanthus floridulus TaxID=154761 RepID=UPI0034588467
MVQEVSGTSWLMLTRTNYDEWAVTMKVKLRARQLWNASDKGADNEEDDMSALEAILAAVPTEYRELLGVNNSAKEVWEAIAAMRIGFDRTKKTTAQLLEQEYINLKFKDDESMEGFSLRMLSAGGGRAHGVGHSNNGQRQAAADKGGVGFLDEEIREASSSHGGDGKRRDKASSEKKKKKKVDPNACWCCGKTSHWAKECPNHKQENKAEAHLAWADKDDEATLLMAMFCALHDVEAKEKREVMAVEGHCKALKAINFDEPRAQVHLGRVGG